MFAGLLSELRIKLRDEQPALSYGLPSELRIKLRDGQPFSLVKSSLLNTFMLNEVHIYQVLDSERIASYTESMNYRVLSSERSSPMQLSNRYETETACHPHPNQERGELKFIAQDGEFRFLLPRMDGYLDYWTTSV